MNQTHDMDMETEQNEKSCLSLQEFCDMEQLYRLVDNWSKSSGMYAVIVDTHGNRTSDSFGITEFCQMVHENEKGNINPKTGEQLVNYWGYSTIGFFAPKTSYSSDKTPGGAVREFKQLVKELHKAGIEVILDVVYNHTYSTDSCFQKTVPDYYYRKTTTVHSLMVQVTIMKRIVYNKYIQLSNLSI